MVLPFSHQLPVNRMKAYRSDYRHYSFKFASICVQCTLACVSMSGIIACVRACICIRARPYVYVSLYFVKSLPDREKNELIVVAHPPFGIVFIFGSCYHEKWSTKQTMQVRAKKSDIEIERIRDRERNYATPKKNNIWIESKNFECVAIVLFALWCSPVFWIEREWKTLRSPSERFLLSFTLTITRVAHDANLYERKIEEKVWNLVEILVNLKKKKFRFINFENFLDKFWKSYFLAEKQ